MPADADDTGTDIVEALRADAIATPVLRRFHAYWDGKRNGRAMPARADIDPLEFVWALGMVSLIDALPGGNFRFRVDGTRTAELFGADMTMRTLDDYPDAARRERLRAVYGRVVRDAAPLLWRRVLTLDAKRWRVESVLLPFSDGDDGGRAGSLASVLAAEPG